jgi:gliding motility-associated-like protein
MKQNLIILFILFINAFSLNAQNLVTNPSFEEYYQLPNGKNDFYLYIKDWGTGSRGTTDFFHTDSPAMSSQIPCNWFGCQNARTGNAYIGIHSWLTKDKIEREFAGVDLLEVMQVGHEYKLSMYVSLEDNYECASNGIGFLLSEYPIMTTYGQKMHYFEPSIIIDTTNWVKIEGLYLADKKYEYVTIGNFLLEDDPRFKTLILDSTKTDMSCSYYVDDVSIVPTGKVVSVTSVLEEGCFPIEGSASINHPKDTNTSWEWYLNNVLVSDTDEAINFEIDKGGHYVVKLVIRGEDLFLRFTDTLLIPDNIAPIADFDLPEDPKFGEAMTFKNFSERALNYYWDLGDGTTSSLMTPTHTYLYPAEYKVSLIVEDILGCQDKMEKTLYARCSSQIDYNTFTPNGDGLNDVFPFDSLNICGDVISIYVLDKWGRTVYQSNDTSIPWDGGNQPSGTYFYVAKYKAGEEGGYITLIRER